MRRVTLALAGFFLALPSLARGSSTSLICEGVGPGYKIVNGKCVQAGSKNLDGSEGFLQTISEILIFIVGVAAVIVIIVGGLRYVLSGGDSGAIKSAKDTILYGIIGLIVAIIAYGLVNFVINRLL